MENFQDQNTVILDTTSGR